MDIDRARLDVHVLPPYLIQDLGAAKDPVRILREKLEQFKLSQTQPDQVTVKGHFIGVVVDA